MKKGYIKRWRVLAMLNNIKYHLQDENINTIIDNYIKFATQIDEDDKRRGKIIERNLERY